MKKYLAKIVVISLVIMFFLQHMANIFFSIGEVNAEIVKMINGYSEDELKSKINISKGENYKIKSVLYKWHRIYEGKFYFANIPECHLPLLKQGWKINAKSSVLDRKAITIKSLNVSYNYTAKNQKHLNIHSDGKEQYYTVYGTLTFEYTSGWSTEKPPEKIQVLTYNTGIKDCVDLKYECNMYLMDSEHDYWGINRSAIETFYSAEVYQDKSISYYGPSISDNLTKYDVKEDDLVYQKPEQSGGTGGTPAQKATVALRNVNLSTNSKKEYIKNLYSLVLGRNASEQEVESYVNMTPQKIAFDIIFSDVSQSKNQINSKSNEDFIKLLYKFILGRDGDASGIASNVTFMNNGASKEDMINSFVQSDEFLIYVSKLDKVSITSTAVTSIEDTIKIENTSKKEYIRLLYERVLGRVPSNDEIRTHLSSTVETITYNIIFSQESRNKNNVVEMKNADFISKAYQWVLGRNIDESSQTTQLTKLNNLETEYKNKNNQYYKRDSKADWIKQTILKSTEFKDKITKFEWSINISNESKQLYINSLYEKCLKREATNSEIANRMGNSLQSNAVGIIMSNEANTRVGIKSMTDENFVKFLYTCLLNRNGDQNGIQSNVAYLKKMADAGKTNGREQLIRTFVESDEFYNNRSKEIKNITLNKELCSAMYYALINRGINVVQPSETSLLISTSDIYKITEVDLGGKSITDLTGISNFINLETVFVANNKISNIDDLVKLKKLKKLNLNNNNLGDTVSKIWEITSLEELYLDGNKLTNNIIDDNIGKLTNLKKLTMSVNSLNNLSALSGLSNLNYLYVIGNNINDISGISNLKLGEFGIGANSISATGTDMEVVLPNIISNVKNNGSLVYSADNFECDNCIVKDGKMILSDMGKDASVRVKGGAANNTVFIYSNTLTSVDVKDAVLANRLQKELGDTVERIDSNGKYTFKMSNDKLYSVRNLDLSAGENDGEKITDISGLESFVNISSLDLSNNNISNLELLSKLENINSLTLINCNLTNLDWVKNITNLKQLDVSKNNIDNIEGLSNLKSLETLLISDNNIKNNIMKLNNLSESLKILDISNNDVTDVSSMKFSNLQKFYASRNSICDIGNIVENKNMDVVELNNNEITLYTTTDSIDIPSILQDVIKLSSNNALECNGCALSGNKIVLSNGYTSATIRVKEGYASDTVVTIERSDITPPEINVEYKFDNETGNVIVTATSNEPLKRLYRYGWEMSKDAKVATRKYEYDAEELIIFTDLAGNETKKMIDVKGTVNPLVPGLYVKNSIYEPTTGNVVVTIGANEPLYDYEYFNLNYQMVSGKIVITLDENWNHELPIYTEKSQENGFNPSAGVRLNYRVENIDRTAPVTNVEYSTTQKTKSAVNAIIWADEEIKLVDSANVKSEIVDVDENNNVRYGIMLQYNENVTTQMQVRDLAGNTSTVDINITNIDTGVDGLNIKTSGVDVTNSGVQVNIKANEGINLISGGSTVAEAIKQRIVAKANLSREDALYLVASTNFVTLVVATQDLNENNDLTMNIDDYYYGTVAVKDNSGNTAVGLVDATHIDTEKPMLVRGQDVINEDGSITVTLVSSEEIAGDYDGWTVSDDKKTLSKVFNSNKVETLKISDLVGNITEYEVDVRGVETIKYEVVMGDDEDSGKVIVLIDANKKLKEIDGWTLLDDKTRIAKLMTPGEKCDVVIEDIDGNFAEVFVDTSYFVVEEDVEDAEENNGEENKSDEDIEEENKNEENKEEDNKIENNKNDKNESPILNPQTGSYFIITTFISLILCSITYVVLLRYTKESE